MTFWVGCLWATEFVVVPLLFARIDDHAVAGMLAGGLFTMVGYIGRGCAVYLLLSRLARFGAASPTQPFSRVVLLVLALAGELGVQPIPQQLKLQARPKDVMGSVFHDRFDTWRGLASGRYLAEIVPGIVLVAIQRRG